MTSEMVTKLNGIATGANAYVLPGGDSTLGGIKSGNDIYMKSGVGELQWGSAVAGDVNLIDGAYIDDLQHNKLAFLSANGIKIEYSNDNGATFTNLATSDSGKRALVTTENSYSIGNHPNNVTINDKLRITLNSNIAGGNIYTSMKRLLIYVSTNGAGGSNVILQTRNINNYLANSDTWTTNGTYDLAGWPGWNSIPLITAFGGGSTQTYQTAQIRMTFGIKSLGASANNLSVSKIRMIGITDW